MSRKFSLAYLTIPGTAPVDQIRIAKEAGYDFVSLRTIDAPARRAGLRWPTAECSRWSALPWSAPA